MVANRIKYSLHWHFLREPWAGYHDITQRHQNENGGYLDTDNYCKDTTLVSLVIATEAFASLDTLGYIIISFGYARGD